MPSWKNRYFAPVEPIYYFEHVGYSRSNVHIGRSQAFEMNMVGRNAGPDCVFHILVGGDFIEMPDGTMRSVSFKRPKPLLEKEYGIPETSEAMFEGLLKSGSVCERPAPTRKFDYAKARELPSFDEVRSNPITVKEVSVTYERMVSRAWPILVPARDAELDVRTSDFGQDRRVVVNIRREGQEVVSMQLLETGGFYLRGNDKFFDAPALKELAGTLDLVKKTHINDCGFWATDIDVLREPALLEHIAHALDIDLLVSEDEPAAPGP